MAEKSSNLPRSMSTESIENPKDYQSTEVIQDDNHAMAFDKDRRKILIPRSYLPHVYDPSTIITNPQTDPDHSSGRIEQDDDPFEPFDTFVLNSFPPFSGAEDVIKWLNDIEQKFNQRRISRSLRFAAIPLLVVDEAKRKYIKKRNQISSFEDFYEFLLTTFERTVTFSCDPTTSNHCSSKSNQNLHDRRNSTSTNDKSMCNTFDNPEFSPKPPILRSTALIDLDDTAITNNKPMSTFSLTGNTTSSVLDHTTNDLRKAILESFVKTPKTFQGGKEDVIKWLEDLEHLFEIAQIPDPNKLALISYSLRGDALQWYKTVKSTLNTWPDFVKEIKQAFTSTYQQELAFKKLESYTQTSNQSILNYYNEMIKLCQEADPTMTESTKLKHLLSKAKSTIQFEVRRKKPTTAAEFLLYAKEIEELYQLSNLSLNQQPSLKLADPVPAIDNKSNVSNNQYHPPTSAVPQQGGTDFNYSYSSTHYRPFPNDNAYTHRSYGPRYTTQPRPNRQFIQPRGYYNNNQSTPRTNSFNSNHQTKSFNSKPQQTTYYSNNRTTQSNEPKLSHPQAAIQNDFLSPQPIPCDPPLQSFNYHDQSVQFDPSLPMSSYDDQPPLDSPLPMTTSHYHF